VAEGTIKNSCKDLYPHVSKIIPTWYAKEEDLKNLCNLDRIGDVKQYRYW